MATPAPSAFNRQYDHIPVGTVIPYAGVVLPSPKWRWCDSSPINSALYPDLAQVMAPSPNVPGFNTASAYMTGGDFFGAGYTPAGSSGGVINYSLTLGETDIPPFPITYGGSSWSASLPHTGITNGSEQVCNDTRDSYVQYYSSGAHQSDDVTFQGLSSFELWYKLGGVATPIAGSVNITDATLATIQISYIIKAL